MANKKIVFVLLTAMLCVFVLAAAASAAGSAPGSEADPVVTKSYVDQKIYDALTGGEFSSDEVMALVEYAVKQQVQNVQGTSFAPVSVDAGQTIYGGEGCEMILRTGSGTIVTSTDTVVNATSGVDLNNGAPVPKGNLLIFPRDDGRGITTNENCWFIVKGNYSIR